MKDYLTQAEHDAIVAELKKKPTERRLRKLVRDLLAMVEIGPEPYDPKFGDDKVCVCGHQYHRHFDSYDDMSPVGCKYCSCGHYGDPGFKEGSDEGR